MTRTAGAKRTAAADTVTRSVVPYVNRHASTTSARAAERKRVFGSGGQSIFGHSAGDRSVVGGLSNPLTDDTVDFLERSLARANLENTVL
jgi:hypothetical protein